MRPNSLGVATLNGRRAHARILSKKNTPLQRNCMFPPEVRAEITLAARAMEMTEAEVLLMATRIGMEGLRAVKYTPERVVLCAAADFVPGDELLTIPEACERLQADPGALERFILAHRISTPFVPGRGLCVSWRQLVAEVDKADKAKSRRVS